MGVQSHGGPNQTSVEKGGDELWIAEKFQSNTEIAGCPRNSFRASVGNEFSGGKALNELVGASVLNSVNPSLLLKSVRGVRLRVIQAVLKRA